MTEFQPPVLVVLGTIITVVGMAFVWFIAAALRMPMIDEDD